MIMSREEKDRVWEELVKSSNERMGVVRKEKVVRRKEEGVERKERLKGVNSSFLSDLKLFVILLVFWISFVSIIELVGAGC